MTPHRRQDCWRLIRLTLREEAQDLVEYALLISLVAFGLTAGLRSLASHVSSAFTAIGTTVSSDLT